MWPNYHLVFVERRTLVSKEIDTCDEANESKFDECLEGFIDREMGCVLPWRVGRAESGS